MRNKLELKTISELNQFSFFVPSYQRGFKWTQKEVNDLLNDINEFKPRVIDNSDEKTWYCLQPIVVKNRYSNNQSFEVIDGTQSQLYTFEAKYNLETPKIKFIQTAYICNPKT